MAATELPQFIAKMREIRAFLMSRRCMSISKGILAYMIAFVLILSQKFDELSAYPNTFNGAVLIAIVLAPGQTVGECLSDVALGVGGVLVGALNFFILANLGHTPAAQVPVFFLMVYLLALVKAQGLKYFPCSLLGILMSFNGIYTSLMRGGEFEAKYLESYLRSYLWGAGIVVFVNLVIFPHTSETQLRKTLAVSLEHIGAFAHLISKTYTLSITEEEKAVRDRLNQSIRADLGFLSQKIKNTSFEITFSRWSMQDYASYVEKTRQLQLNLITIYSSLMSPQREDVELFKAEFLPAGIGSFTRLCQDARQTVYEIGQGLGCESLTLPTVGYQEYFDVESQGLASKDDERELKRRLKLILNELQTEGTLSLKRREIQRTISSSASCDLKKTDRRRFVSGATSGASPTLALAKGSGGTILHSSDISGLTSELQHHFAEFRDGQVELLTRVLVSGKLHGNDTVLRVHETRPSVWDTFGEDHALGHQHTMRHRNSDSTADDGGLRRRTQSGGTSPTLRHDETQSAPVSSTIANEIEIAEEKAAAATDHFDRVSEGEWNSLVRVFSYVHGVKDFINSLQQYHAEVTAHASRKTGVFGGRRLHFHLYEHLRQGSRKTSSSDPLQKDLSMKEALNILEKRPHNPRKRTIWHRVVEFEKLTRSPTSIFALKTACAATVYATLMWGDKTRDWFVSYGLAGSLLTVAVALTPTLGQSIISWVLQIAGSSLGYLWGLVCLEIFKNVGGHRFNPYGIACMIALFAIPMFYVFYETPRLFVFALLALNGVGIVIVQEYTAVEYLHRFAFDSPPYRVGKLLAGLSIAIVIVVVFQFVLRNPARTQVRKALAQLTYSNLSFCTIMHAYIRAIISVDSDFRPPPEALSKVVCELRHREVKIQQEIISIMPLILFSKVEPHLVNPARMHIAVRIIRANQIILDRMREAREALDSKFFDDVILEGLVIPISAYRRRTIKCITTSMYLCAASLDSKHPLPQDLPRTREFLPDVWHDILLLSSRLGQTPEGRECIKSGEFTRLWFYMLSIMSIGEQLETIEDATKEMFGELEDDPRLV